MDCTLKNAPTTFFLWQVCGHKKWCPTTPQYSGLINPYSMRVSKRQLHMPESYSLWTSRNIPQRRVITYHQLTRLLFREPKIAIHQRILFWLTVLGGCTREKRYHHATRDGSRDESTCGAPVGSGVLGQKELALRFIDADIRIRRSLKEERNLIATQLMFIVT